MIRISGVMYPLSPQPIRSFSHSASPKSVRIFVYSKIEINHCAYGVSMLNSYPVSHGPHPNHASFDLSETFRRPSQLRYSKIYILVYPLKSSAYFLNSSLLPRRFKHYAILVDEYCFEVRGKMGNPAGPAAEKFKYWKRDKDGWNRNKILVGLTDASWDEIVITCKFSFLRSLAKSLSS